MINQTQLADLLNVTKSAVSHALARGTKCGGQDLNCLVIKNKNGKIIGYKRPKKQTNNTMKNDDKKPFEVKVNIGDELLHITALNRDGLYDFNINGSISESSFKAVMMTVNQLNTQNLSKKG